MPQVQRFHALDSFKGLCALFIVVYHLHVSGSFTELEFFRSADLFVELFFVISGFVITHAYGSREKLDAGKFFISRTLRIFPLHVFILGIFILLEFGKFFAYQKGFYFNEKPFTGMTAASEILPNLFLIQAWTPLTENASFNHAAWSISIGYYLYILYAAILIFAFRHRKLLWGALTIAGFLSLYIQQHVLTGFLQTGLSCFYAGALSYCAFDFIRKKINLGRLSMTVLECASLVLVVLTLTSDIAHKQIVASVLFCLVVVVFAFEGGAVARLLRMSAFSLPATLSYSIYLTHAVVLFCLTSILIVAQNKLGLKFAPIIDGVRYLDSGNDLANNLIAALILGAVMVFSSVTYRYVERTGLRFGQYLIDRRTERNPALSLPTVKR